MRLARLLSLLIVCVLLTVANHARAERVHVVAAGHTLGKIAKRYHVSVAAICHANGIARKDPIQPGQKLVIPDKGDKTGEKARQAQQAKAAPPERSDKEERGDKEERSKKRHHEEPDGLQVLPVPGFGDAYYYTPTGPGRLTLRPVLMYLHGRGSHPKRDCQRWAPIARRLGWLICPSGPGARGLGRGWNNTWYTAYQTAMGALKALRARYGRRVQLYGNTLIGFSEGAYAAMNVGVREPRAFNRWLILAANSKYWGPFGYKNLKSARHRLRKVYLITGEKDGVIAGTRAVREVLRRAKVSTRITTPKDMGHELKLESKRWLYHAALVWLNQG